MKLVHLAKIYLLSKKQLPVEHNSQHTKTYVWFLCAGCILVLIKRFVSCLLKIPLCHRQFLYGFFMAFLYNNTLKAQILSTDCELV